MRQYLDSAANTDNRGEEGLLVGYVVAAKEDVLPGSAVEGQLCPLLRLLQGVILVPLARSGGRVQFEDGDRRLGRLAVRVGTANAEDLQKQEFITRCEEWKLCTALT